MYVNGILCDIVYNILSTWAEMSSGNMLKISLQIKWLGRHEIEDYATGAIASASWIGTSTTTTVYRRVNGYSACHFPAMPADDLTSA